MFPYLSDVASKVNKQINKDTVMTMKQRKWLPAIRQSVLFRDKEQLQLSHSGHIQRQESGTDPSMHLLFQDRH